MVVQIEEQEDPTTEFKFHLLPPMFKNFQSRETTEALTKWGFGEDIFMLKFRFEQKLEDDDIPRFLQSFVKSREFSHVGQMSGCVVLNPSKVEVEYEELSTSAVSMKFLNKFAEAGIINEGTGRIRGRLEDDWEGVPIVDVLREAMWMEESELYDVYSEAERKEFLFHILKRISTGGASNQYEDFAEDYFKVVKDVYKDLLVVQKNASGDTEIISKVFEVKSLGDGGQLFRKDHPTNFCYFVVDQLSRQVSMWYFGYRPFW